MKLRKVKPPYTHVPGHSIRVAVVTVRVWSAVPRVKGLKLDPAGYAPRTALLMICSLEGRLRRMPRSVVPSVIALGSKDGRLASTQTSPLRGSTAADPTRG